MVHADRLLFAAAIIVLRKVPAPVDIIYGINPYTFRLELRSLAGPQFNVVRCVQL